MSRKLRIISVGKRHDASLASFIETYEKRLSSRLRIEWQYVSHQATASQDRNMQITSESNAIRSTLKDAEYIVVLDDTGTQLSSEGFADTLARAVASTQDVVFIIGGAYGVDDALLKQADIVWSLGKLTLPHQLVRAVLIEQLYRAVNIWGGGRYHHGD